jgi:hypothetical protein
MLRGGILLAGTLATFGLTAGGAAAASSSVLTVRGTDVKPALKTVANTNQDSNWFGYQQGTLEQSSPTLFNSITGKWTVPTASSHTPNTSQASSDWIGIGGGCVDSGCTAGDESLIQTGTEQDVDSTGATTYDAWYEIIPAPEIEITNMTVDPGDQMTASVAEDVADSEVWTVTITDLTRDETYTTTVPYSSTHDTAEWIEETPLNIGTDAGFAPLPNLTDPYFNGLTVNGASPNLQSSEQIQLVDSNGNVIGTPSQPNSTRNGFSDCAWATTCSLPKDVEAAS